MNKCNNNLHQALLNNYNNQKIDDETKERAQLNAIEIREYEQVHAVKSASHLVREKSKKVSTIIIN